MLPLISQQVNEASKEPIFEEKPVEINEKVIDDENIALNPCDPFQDCQRDFCSPPSLREERELLSGVCCESRRLYFSLDCEGKNKAVILAERFENKNLAIQEAAKEMAKRQLVEYPNQETYQKQIQERSGQYLYNDRFGY